ncbi:type III secretion system export apparatus subunit SctU [bacterium]|nr:type III secretion system export apparatus subunit SctU [bacterium]
MAEKSEKATPKKLRDARKKGQVAKSKDFPSAFTFIVSITGVLAFSSYFYHNLAGFILDMFSLIKVHDQLQQRIGGVMMGVIETIFYTSLPLMVFISVIGVLVNFLIIGPMFSVEAMKLDIKKLNPVTNLKNLFKMKTFIELIKSILKIAGAVALIYSVVYTSLEELISTCGLPLHISASVFATFLQKVVIRVGLFFIAVGIFDLVYQKKNFAKEMKMEKFEVKQEYKDSEGDPNIKGRRKQIAQEIAYQDGPSSVKRAKAVVTNPTHIAVAIEYDADNEPAPKIVTMGLDIVAEEIIKVAVNNDIPVMRNIELAHTLFYKGAAGDYVPEETYEAIAEVLKWIAKLEEEEKEKEKEEQLEIFT